MGTYRSSAPREIQWSFLFWLVAIAAGVFEMVIAVSRVLSSDPEAGNSIFIAAGIRGMIFAGLSYIIIEMYRGRNWARLVLAVLLGGVGTLSLLIDPIQWMLEGNSLNDAFTGMTLHSLLFGLSRVVHLASVIIAFILMFQPAANQYFRRAA